jgi:hypothetical protein
MNGYLRRSILLLACVLNAAALFGSRQGISPFGKKDGIKGLQTSPLPSSPVVQAQVGVLPPSLKLKPAVLSTKKRDGIFRYVPPTATANDLSESRGQQEQCMAFLESIMSGKAPGRGTLGQADVWPADTLLRYWYTARLSLP